MWDQVDRDVLMASDGKELHSYVHSHTTIRGSTVRNQGTADNYLSLLFLRTASREWRSMGGGDGGVVGSSSRAASQKAKKYYVISPESFYSLIRNIGSTRLVRLRTLFSTFRMLTT